MVSTEIRTTSISRRSLFAGLAGVGALALVAPATASAASPVTLRRTLSFGARGGDVKAVQQRLASLGYWCGSADGVYGALASQAVMACQSVAGLSRDGVCGPKTLAALNRGVRPGVRTRGLSGIEIDKARQVIIVTSGGQVNTILHTSTASGQRFSFRGRTVTAVTPSGDFRVWTAHQSGWQDGVLGRMYRPYYFNGDIAIHGSPEIPSYPASHGCCRVSTAAQDMLLGSGKLKMGTRVVVY